MSLELAVAATAAIMFAIVMTWCAMLKKLLNELTSQVDSYVSEEHRITNAFFHRLKRLDREVEVVSANIDHLDGRLNYIEDIPAFDELRFKLIATVNREASNIAKKSLAEAAKRLLKADSKQ